MSEIQANKLSPASGTALQVGDSGDTITIPSGATITNSGTATGFGESNTPNFMVFLSANQSISDNSNTKVQCNTELIDTDNAYDNSSNYRFTVPSGKDGKYFFFAQVRVNTSSDFDVAQMKFYVNGTEKAFSSIRNEHDECFTLMHLRDLSAGEYVELYFYQNQGGTININGDTNIAKTYFGGYKIS